MADSLVREIAEKAKAASRVLAALPAEKKNAALRAMASALRANGASILVTNADDVAAAKNEKLSEPMIRRLTLRPKKIEGMANAIEQIAALPDPVGDIEELRTVEDGLRVGRMRVPIGVIGMIYESRPDATSDAIALCLKSGNAVILRGGHEVLATNRAIESVLRDAARRTGIPEGAFAVLPRASREDALELLGMSDLIDLMVPRGGEGLIAFVDAHARMPVLRHAKGVCHLYVDEFADLDMAAALLINGKAQNPAVCNATEAVIVHSSVAAAFWEKAAPGLRAAGVEVRADAATCAHVSWFAAGTEGDWGREFLSLTLAAREVGSFDEALADIARHGSHHTEAIVTRDEGRATQFHREVDASAVLVNASTRLNDGGVFGLGAELGISTSKLHAYGPMGVRELTTRKFVVFGAGQVRK